VVDVGSTETLVEEWFVAHLRPLVRVGAGLSQSRRHRYRAGFHALEL